ncbi:hypothetical protein [Silvimonas sp.]|nr:hypothetical protein [Silvimonas sp.]MDR3427997.1 hypothetical protein [Silvimonas sp.]
MICWKVWASNEPDQSVKLKIEMERLHDGTGFAQTAGQRPHVIGNDGKIA